MKHLKPTEKAIYLLLVILGKATQKQIADILGIDLSNIFRSLKSLSDKDYITISKELIKIAKYPTFKNDCVNFTSNDDGCVNFTSNDDGCVNFTSNDDGCVSFTANSVNFTVPTKKTTPLSSPLPSSLRLSSSIPPIIPPEKKSIYGHSDRMTAPTPQDDTEEFHLTSDEVELQAQTNAYLNKAFDAFWKIYPRKVKKQIAKESYLRVVKNGVDPNAILEGVKRARKEWALEEKQFIPHASTWLNQSRWEDDLELDPTLEAEATLEPIKPKRTVTPATALQLFQPTYSKDEELFLKEYGKRPRDVHEEAAFHRAFATALEEVKDAYLLANCAKVAVQDMREKEGDTNKLRRPHIWLDDRAYNDTLSRAKSLPRYTSRIDISLY